MRSLVLCALFAAGLCGPATSMTIPEAKLLADNQPVTLAGKCVTYVSTDFFYVEEDGRNMGIRVEKAAHGLTVGMRANAIGTMKTKISRERYIQAAGAVQDGEGTVAPLGLNNATIGGQDWFYSLITGAGQKGASGVDGLNNVGLLVRVWGRYEQLDATTFAIEDGAGQYIRCSALPSTFLYEGWQHVELTGVISLYKLNATIFLPNLLVRDIEVLAPPEAVSVPGMPSGYAYPLVNGGYAYSTTGATCNLGHVVEYSFNWGDGSSSPWSPSTSASHSWSALGTAKVTVTARCTVHPYLEATSAELPANVTDIEMIYVPAGSFLMGDNNSTPSEFPQHSVYLSGYYIGKYEVTRGEYRRFIEAGGYSSPAWWSSAGWNWKGNRTAPPYWDSEQDWGTGTFTQTEAHPVVGVTYYEAEAFCNWAGGHLPTEAQWEKAARWDGTPRAYPWGDVWDAEKCNNKGDTNPAGGDGHQTAPVGSYPAGASPYGLQDMAGNVWERCADWFGDSYYSVSPSVDPPGPSSGDYRVMRGDCWDDTGSSSSFRFRCASRNLVVRPDAYTYHGGFRLAR